MRKEMWLVCGTRIRNNPKYKQVVFGELDRLYNMHQELIDNGLWQLQCIIQGECSDSADVYAKEWATSKGIKVESVPAKKGTYLTRNVEMVSFLKDDDEIIAFWNGYSYGTAHTIAQGILHNKIVSVVDLFKELRR
jgi:hypothetical protein